jgi:Protein of unknown function (DUF3822)
MLELDMIRWQKYFIIAYKTMQSQQININNRKQVIKSNEAVHIILQVQKGGILLCAIKVYNNEIAWTSFYEHSNNVADGRSIMAVMKDCKQLPIKSCIVGLDEDRFMILPTNMSELEVCKSAFDYVHHIENNEILEQQFLPWQDFFGAYLIKNCTKHIFSDWDTNILFANTAISLLVIYSAYLQADAQQIFISLSEQNLTMTIYTNAKLQLHNTYLMQSAVDVLYQIQKAIHVLKLKNANIVVNGLDAPSVLKEIQSHYPTAHLQALPNGFIYPSQIDAATSTFLLPILAIAKYANH